METKIKVNGKDIIKNSNYSRFKKYVNGKLPLQYWMHPIKQDDWRGFLEEIIADTGESSLNISFTGREIDFNDLKNELEERNSLRTDEDKLSITYESNLNISDIQVSNEIDKIIDKMLSEEFKSIIDQKKNQNLKKTLVS